MFASGTLPEDLAATLDANTLIATLGYSPVGDAVSLDMNGFELEGIDFADGEAWGAKQIVALLPALVTQGSSGGDTLAGRANLRNALHGGAGDDSLAGGTWDDLLEGGDGADRADGGRGSDIYYYAGTETGIDRIEDSGIDTIDYLDAYYAALGVADWRTRGAHGGQYHLLLEGDGRSYDLSTTAMSRPWPSTPAWPSTSSSRCHRSRRRCGATTTRRSRR